MPTIYYASDGNEGSLWTTSKREAMATARRWRQEQRDRGDTEYSYVDACEIPRASVGLILDILNERGYVIERKPVLEPPKHEGGVREATLGGD